MLTVSLQADKWKEELKRMEQQLKLKNSDHETQLLRLRTEVPTRVCVCVYV